MPFRYTLQYVDLLSPLPSPSLSRSGTSRNLVVPFPLWGFRDDLFLLQIQGKKFWTFILSVFRNLVRENGGGRDCQCFFSSFQCSWQQLLCCSGGWCENLSLCACVHGVGNGSGSVDRWKLVWRGMLFPPPFVVFHDLALGSTLGSSIV